jgi:hypothetical protein
MATIVITHPCPPDGRRVAWARGLRERRGWRPVRCGRRGGRRLSCDRADARQVRADGLSRRRAAESVADRLPVAQPNVHCQCVLPFTRALVSSLAITSLLAQHRIDARLPPAAARFVDGLGNVQAGPKRCSRPNQKIAPKRKTQCSQTRYPDPKTSPLHESGASPCRCPSLWPALVWQRLRSRRHARLARNSVGLLVCYFRHGTWQKASPWRRPRKPFKSSHSNGGLQYVG